MLQLLADNWITILASLLALAKIIVNITPSKKDNQIFNKIDDLIDKIVPNFDKNWQVHKNNVFKKKK